VTVFGNRAEALAQHLHKGSRVYIDGRLEARPWLDRQQQPHAGLEVVADEIQFASPRADDERTAPPVASGECLPPVEEAELEDLPF